MQLRPPPQSVACCDASANSYPQACCFTSPHFLFIKSSNQGAFASLHRAFLSSIATKAILFVKLAHALFLFLVLVSCVLLATKQLLSNCASSPFRNTRICRYIPYSLSRHQDISLSHREPRGKNRKSLLLFFSFNITIAIFLSVTSTTHILRRKLRSTFRHTSKSANLKKHHALFMLPAVN